MHRTLLSCQFLKKVKIYMAFKTSKLVSTTPYNIHFFIVFLAVATPASHPPTHKTLVNYTFHVFEATIEDWGWSNTEGFFFPLLKLWLFKTPKLHRALINGSRDASALSHSVLHNRQTYEAEPGMEYWRNEWKCTQIRDPVSPLSTLSSCSLLCIFVEEGLPQESHSLLITGDQRGMKKMHA